MIREQTLNDLNTFRPWKFCTLFYIPGYVPMCSSLQSMGTWVEFVSCCCVKIVQILIMLNWLIVLFRSPISFSVQFSQSCPTVCDPMDCSMPGFPVHHQLTELAQIHVHRVGDAIQPSHPVSFPSPSAFNLSQHQGLFKWVSSLHQVAKVLEFQLQYQSFQWIFKTDFL